MGTTRTPSTARAAAVAALCDWGRRNATIDDELPPLVAAVWNSGERNVSEIARAAGVKRDRVYAALRAAGIEPVGKGDDPRITRILAAITELSAALAPGALNPALFWKTPATLNPLIGNALLALAKAAGPDQLVPALQQVQAAADQLVPEDREALRPVLQELGEAFARYVVSQPGRVQPSPRPGNPLLRAATRSAGHLPGGGS